ncbi:MAG: ABC transporter permease [Candidatus Hermodarchaeota archaeon]
MLSPLASLKKYDFKSIGLQLGEFILANKTLTVGLILLGGIVFMALFADFISPYDYAEMNDNCGEDYPFCHYAPPSPEHPLGTTMLGRDMLSRLIYGSRVALIMAVGATIIALAIGVPLGILSGYFGGPIDRLATMIADAIYAFPSLLLAILLAIAFTEFADLKVVLAVSVSTAVVYTPLYFRIVRSQVLQVKEESYIEAAQSMGARTPTILIRYVVPNILAAPIALIAFNMTEAILTNAALAFLGMGIQPPTPDWGYDVYDNRSLSMIRNYPWLIFFPALMIFLLSFAFSLIGDALNDKFNPLIAKKHEAK